MRWTDPEWLAEATAWIDERVERTGAIEQPHIRSWATALRVPTSDGILWFKANAAAVAHEGPVIELLATRLPALVPALVAVDHDRAWILMRDGGEQLLQRIERERRLELWLEVLPLYAELQLTATADAGKFIANGVPDRRLQTLPQQYEALLERLRGSADGELVAAAVEHCEQLASPGVMETIQHDDLHDRQVLTKHGRYVFFDWGDSCVAHPFFSMSVTLEGVIRWGLDDVEDSVELQPFRDAYLEPFTAVAPKAELDAALDAALRLGWICRSLTVEAYASGLPDGAERERQYEGLDLRLGFVTR